MISIKILNMSKMFQFVQDKLELKDFKNELKTLLITSIPLVNFKIYLQSSIHFLVLFFFNYRSLAV